MNFIPNMIFEKPLLKDAAHPYTVTSNSNLSFTRDRRLSGNEALILHTLFSKDDKTWHFSVSGFQEISSLGRTAIYSALKKLVQHGYLVIEKGRDAKGRFTKSIYHFSEIAISPTEQPEEKNSSAENGFSSAFHPCTDFREMDSETQVNTKKQNTEKQLFSSQSVSQGLTDGQTAEPENLFSFNNEEFTTLEHLLRDCADFDLMPLKVKCFVDEAVKYLEEAVISGKFRLSDVIGKLEDIISKEGSLFTCLTTINQICENALENLQHAHAKEKFLASTFCKQFKKYKPQIMVKSVPECAETESDFPAAASNEEQFTELECLMKNCEYDSMKQVLKDFVPNAIRYMKNAVISGSAELSDIIDKLKEIISKEGSLFAFMKKISYECTNSLKKMKYANAKENYLTSVVYRQLQKYKPKEPKAANAETPSGQALTKHTSEHQGRPVPSQRSESESPTLNFREMLMQLQNPLTVEHTVDTPVFDNIENFKEYFGSYDYDEWYVSQCIIPYSFKENPVNLENALKFLVGFDDMPADTFDESEYKAFVERTIYFLAKEIHAEAKKEGMRPDNLISRLNEINMDLNEREDTLQSFISCFYKKFQKAITQYPARTNKEAYVTKMLVNYLDGEYQAQDMIGIGNMQVMTGSFAGSGAKSSGSYRKKASGSKYDSGIWEGCIIPRVIDD